MPEKKCSCFGWKNSWPQILGAQQLAANHGMPYTGDVFEYCPWCGMELHYEEKDLPAMQSSPL